MQIDTVVLDLDGTLVDSVPVHVLAWQAAFRDVGLTVPSHRVHRAIGMGGDRIVEALAGAAAEARLGDELRKRHPHHLDRLFAAIAPTDGAVALLDSLRRHGVHAVLASSGDRDLTDRLLELLEGAETLLERTVSGDDASSSKPSGELVSVALEQVDAKHAVVVGDSVWDVLAAHDAGVRCIGLLTGGISSAELLEAGAAAVHESPRDLATHLDESGTLLPS